MTEDNSVVANTERTEEELDKLADSTETSRNSTRGMTETPEPAAKGAKAGATPDEQFEFDHGGKKVKGTRDQIIKWAQMGYDRPQVMAKLNQEKTAWETQKKEWDTQRSQWEQKWGIYKQIDDFAAQNKDWWNYVNTNWQNRANGVPQNASGAPVTAQQPDPYAPKLQSLEQQLGEMRQFVQSVQQEKISAQEKEKDSQLATEIQSIREQYKDLDWASLDENGKSLELKVLEHAQANGISSFRAAMRDLLHDELLTRAESQAKIAVAKGIQTKTKLGVLGESPTPQGKWSPKSNKPIRNQSYEDLEQEIREELRHGAR